MSSFFMRRKSTDGQDPPAGLGISDRITFAVAALAVVSQARQWLLNWVVMVVLGGIAVLLAWEGLREKALGWRSTGLAILVAGLFVAAAFAQFLQGKGAWDDKAMGDEKQRIQDTIVKSGKLQMALYKNPTNTKLQADLPRYYLSKEEGGDVLPVILGGFEKLNARKQRFSPTASVVIRVDVDGITISPEGTSATAAAAEVWRSPLVDARTGQPVPPPKGHPTYIEYDASPYELEKRGTSWRIRYNPSP